MSLNHPVMFGVRGSYSICSGENIGNPRATTITCFGFQNEVTASSLFPRHCLDGPVKAFQLWNHQSQHEPISFLERKVIRTGTKMAKNSVSGRSFSLEKKWRSCSKRRMWVVRFIWSDATSLWMAEPMESPVWKFGGHRSQVWTFSAPWPDVDACKLGRQRNRLCRWFRRIMIFTLDRLGWKPSVGRNLLPARRLDATWPPKLGANIVIWTTLSVKVLPFSISWISNGRLVALFSLFFCTEHRGLK